MTVYLDGIPTHGWDAAARTLTDISAEEIFDLADIDSLYPHVSPASAASANAFGSWVEVGADVGAGKRLLGFFLVVGSATSSNVGVEIEFGEGTSGHEVRVVGRVLVGIAAIFPFSFPLWKSLSDNARLAVRARDEASGAKTYRIAAYVG